MKINDFILVMIMQDINMTEKQEKLNKLARDVLILSRNTLLVNLRFLDAALSQFELFPITESTLMTDGKHILYNSKHLLENYKKAKEIPVRDYLHMVMHCVFKHMYMGPNLNRLYWDLACDIAVENVITDLNLKAVTTAREQQQAKYLSSIKTELKHVTAEKVYSWLRQNVPDPEKIKEMRDLFYADDHEIWYVTIVEIETKYGLTLYSEKMDEQDSEDNDHTGEFGMRIAMAAVWQTI